MITEELSDGMKILDVGASNRALGDKLLRKFPAITYKTMDIDRAQVHDYYTLEEISETFDMIILSEVIEHLEFQEAMAMVDQLLTLLTNHGSLIISTPNIHHPNRYWCDPDHKTPYSYESAGAALLTAGFKVTKIYRIYNDQILRRLFRLYFASYLHRYLDVDFAASIVVVARKVP